MRCREIKREQVMTKKAVAMTTTMAISGGLKSTGSLELAGDEWLRFWKGCGVEAAAGDVEGDVQCK